MDFESTRGGSIPPGAIDRSGLDIRAAAGAAADRHRRHRAVEPGAGERVSLVREARHNAWRDRDRRPRHDEPTPAPAAGRGRPAHAAFDLNRSLPSPRAIRQASGRPRPSDGSHVLTIFAVPKPFEGHIGRIQRNAIGSWARLRPQCQIVLCGNEPGTSDVADELGIEAIPEVSRNQFGTPLLSSVFRAAEERSRCRLLCYVNADIVLLSDFVAAACPGCSREASFPHGRATLRPRPDGGASPRRARLGDGPTTQSASDGSALSTLAGSTTSSIRGAQSVRSRPLR